MGPKVSQIYSIYISTTLLKLFNYEFIKLIKHVIKIHGFI